MSLPPVTVHIKRKRTDEPVDFLRVHESNGPLTKRRAIGPTTDFLFTRQTSESDLTAPPSSLRRIKEPIPRATSSPCLGTQPAQTGIGDGLVSAISKAIPQVASGATSQQTVQTVQTVQTAFQNAQRSFYISRKPFINPLPVPCGQRQAPIIFLERRSGLKRSHDGSSAQSKPAVALPPPSESSRAQKKPGIHARVPVKQAAMPPQLAATTSTFNVRVPSGAVLPWDVDTERLAVEMQAYTLQEISRSIAKSSSPPLKSSITKITTPSKFKPRMPKLRYHERHPDEVVAHGQDMDIDTETIDLDDSDYIIDTYIRMPANTVMADLDEEKNCGLLVLDGEVDIDEFYRESLEEDDEEEDEEEDENAENHYSADYPDEEVDSDDEFGRNPYHYRHKNSDEPEDNYSDQDDDDDATFSDDEETRYPWKPKLQPFKT